MKRIRSFKFTGNVTEDCIFKAAVYCLNGGQCLRATLAPIVYNHEDAAPVGKFGYLQIYLYIVDKPTLVKMLEASSAVIEDGCSPAAIPGGATVQFSMSDDDTTGAGGRTVGKKRAKKIKKD